MTEISAPSKSSLRIKLTTPAIASAPYTAAPPTGTTSILSIIALGILFKSTARPDPAPPVGDCDPTNLLPLTSVTVLSDSNPKFAATCCPAPIEPWSPDNELTEPTSGKSVKAEAAFVYALCLISSPEIMVIGCAISSGFLAILEPVVITSSIDSSESASTSVTSSTSCAIATKETKDKAIKKDLNLNKLVIYSLKLI